MISRVEHGFITLGYVTLLHKYAKFNGEQEICENMGQKNPSLPGTVFQPSASLVMLNGDPRDSFFLSHPPSHS